MKYRFKKVVRTKNEKTLALAFKHLRSVDKPCSIRCPEEMTLLFVLELQERFGTDVVAKLIRQAVKCNDVFLPETIADRLAAFKLSKHGVPADFDGDVPF